MNVVLWTAARQTKKSVQNSIAGQTDRNGPNQSSCEGCVPWGRFCGSDGLHGDGKVVQRTAGVFRMYMALRWCAD
jgi:hypothetical protein